MERKIKPPERKTGMSRLWQLAGMQKLYVVLSAIFSAVSVVISFVPYVAVYLIIAHLVQSRGNIDTAILIKYGMFALGGMIGAILVNLMALACSHIAAFKTLYTLRVNFSTHLAQLPLGFHAQNPSGKLRKIIDENIEKLEGFIAHQLPDLIGTFTAPIFIFVMLFVVDWRFGIASIIPVAISYALLIFGFIGKDAAEAMRLYQNKLDSMNDAAVEYARGMSVIKAFGQTVFSFRRFYDLIHEYTYLCLHHTMLYKNKMAAFLTIINTVYLFIIPLSIFLLSSSADYVQVILSSIFYIIFSMSLPAAFTKIMYVSLKGQQIVDGIERMDKILDISPLKEPEFSKKPAGYDIEFKDVSFAYETESIHEGEAVSTGEQLALNHISFIAKQGEVTALVGASGSGKSTIAHLIPRFFDVDSGEITIGGVDVRDMQYEDLMNCVSFVFQDLFLFKQTIAENIRVGKPGASMKEIEDAARAAQAHEFIMALPNGYDTLIGGDIHLSGGEKQRIIIARAIIKDAALIVLDEATAFADPDNEHKIQIAFEQLMKDKTVIVIAHRLSSIRSADKILVLDNGNIIESGKHDELMAKNGKYTKMWKSYTSALDWRITAGGINA